VELLRKRIFFDDLSNTQFIVYLYTASYKSLKVEKKIVSKPG